MPDQAIEENLMDQSTTPNVPPERSLGNQIRRLHYAMASSMEQFTTRHGVSGAQWGYLRHLFYQDGISQRELSDRVGRQGPATVAALKRMEQNGWVQIRKNEHDNRKNLVFMTAAGRELVSQIMPNVPVLEESALRGVSDEEVAVFRQVIARVCANLGDDAALRMIFND